VLWWPVRENGYSESFNSKLRDELLAGEQFSTLHEAKVLIEQWRRYYNAIRPHSSLGYRPPAPETILPSRDEQLSEAVEYIVGSEVARHDDGQAASCGLPRRASLWGAWRPVVRPAREMPRSLAVAVVSASPQLR
jgi:hypothetical protein